MAPPHLGAHLETAAMVPFLALVALGGQSAEAERTPALIRLGLGWS